MISSLTGAYLPSVAAEELAIRQPPVQRERPADADDGGEPDSDGVKVSLSTESTDLLQQLGGESPALSASSENEGHGEGFYSGDEGRGNKYYQAEQATRETNISARLPENSAGVEVGMTQLARMLQSAYGTNPARRGNISFDV